MSPIHALRLLTLASSFCLGLAAPLAAQDTVDADNPKKILEIARGFGSAELEAEDDGAPVIRGRISGYRYKVFFYGCEDGRDCTNIQFWTYTKAPVNALHAVNQWNRNYRFGRAYIDDVGDVTVEMDVNLWGGVTPKNLDDTFDWWRSVLEKANEVFKDPGVLPEAPTPTPGGKTL